MSSLSLHLKRGKTACLVISLGLDFIIEPRCIHNKTLGFFSSVNFLHVNVSPAGRPGRLEEDFFLPCSI